MKEKDSKTRGYEIAESLHRRMKSTAADRGMNLGHAATEAFTAWLDGRATLVTSSRDPSPYPYSASHKEAHETLDFILTEGPQDYQEWITGNLKVFADAIRTGSHERVRVIRKRAKS